LTPAPLGFPHFFTPFMDSAAEQVDKELVVQNRMGIHTRPAAQIVRLANRYPDIDLQVAKDDEVVNGKSIMSLMMLAAGQGSRLRFTAKGAGAANLLGEMEALFARKFDEN